MMSSMKESSQNKKLCQNGNSIGWALSIGVGAGAAIGVAMKNIEMGVALGAAFGMALGVLRGSRASDGDK